MKKKDCVETSGESGIDVTFGAIADHPACMRHKFVTGDDFAVGGRIFFSDDLDSREVRREAGAGELMACSA